MEPLDASHDAAMDADLHDEDAGDDAGAAPDARPEMVRGEDYVLFPELLPADNGVIDVTFAVPRGARSFVLTASPASARRVQLVRLYGPDDALLFDGLAEPPTGTLAHASTRNVIDALPLSVLYPNAPDAAFSPGQYRVQLFADEIADDADDAIALDVVFGRPIDEAEPRVLGIQLWVAGGAGATADDLAADPDFIEALRELRAIYEAAGIEVGGVGIDDLAPERDDLGVVDRDEVIAAIAEELAGFPGRGVHVVLVDRIETETGAMILGKTTGIPAAPPHAELARRGAAIIGLDTLSADPARAGELLAHEIAHALGLRHTSEADGLRHDALEDTPECPAELATFEAASGALLLSAEDCADLDGVNLLFYTSPVTDEPQRTLTDDQTWALTRNPTL